MKFDEKYAIELHKISPSKALNNSIISREKKENYREKRKIKLSMVFAAVLTVFIIVVFNFNNIGSFAKSLFGTWGANLGSERIEFGEIEGISFELEKFKSHSGTKVVKGDSCAYYHDFSSAEECRQLTGIDIIDNNSIEYVKISISTSEQAENIYLVSCFDYKDFRFDLNGLIATNNYNGDTWGYGIDEEVVEIYEYKKEKKAYFVNDSGEVIRVYFQEGCAMYQLSIDTSDEQWAINIGKELIDILCTD